jgi:D-glycero-alpha-D-manno-heptose-7-phosphate kinase
MLISRTPFRVSFVGGGTDLKEYYKDNPGAVLCTSIDKYIYLSIHEYFYPNRYLIKYSKTEETGDINLVQHGIIREVFKKYSINNADFNATADIPAGTGMGSSSAFTCGLIKICSKLNGQDLPNHEIAKIACDIEINILKEPIGKQDQYGCCIGGLNYIQFNPNESVNISPVLLNHSDLNMLQNNLLLFYTGNTRKASSILSTQKNSTLNNNSTKQTLQKMSQMAGSLFKDLTIGGNVDIIGEYLHEAWWLKKGLVSSITNEEYDNIYNIAISNGAIGGKLLGAGGGGFFLFYAKKENHEKLRLALNLYKELKFKFDNEGSQIIYKNN